MYKYVYRSVYIHNCQCIICNDLEFKKTVMLTLEMFFGLYKIVEQ